MEDLSKTERLEKEILVMAEKCGDIKWLRVKRTFFVLSGVVYLLAIYFGLELKTIHIPYYLEWLVLAPIVAGFVMFISYGILYYIIDGQLKEEKAIAKKMGELNAIKFSNKK